MNVQELEELFKPIVKAKDLKPGDIFTMGGNKQEVYVVLPATKKPYWWFDEYIAIKNARGYISTLWEECEVDLVE